MRGVFARTAFASIALPAPAIAAIALAAWLGLFFAHFDAFHHTAVNRLAEQFLNGIDSLLVVA